ncbi:MAG: metallophosphoesterase [Oscillospiraceae bacterium]|nr:metallophosphoesterase [Oscillospiraceae bacterium]
MLRPAVMILIYLVISAAAAALACGLARRAFPGRGRRAVTGISLGLCLAALAFPLAGGLLPDGPAGRFFQRWGNVLLGPALYFSGTLALLWLFTWIPRRVLRRRSGGTWRLPRRWAAGVLAVLLAMTAAVNIAGAVNARTVRVTRYELPKQTLSQTGPLRIVLIADLHIGVNSSPALYERMVRRVNEQEPDLILVAGDIVTSCYGAMEDPEAYASVLRQMKAAYGVFAVYGNHDLEEPLLGGFSLTGAGNAVRHPDMDAFVASCGWKLLRDESVILPDLCGLRLAGRRDESRPGDGVARRAELKELLKGTDPAEPVLLLQHEPAELEELGILGVDLAFSGHTHDGQIFPGNVLARIMGPQSYGLKRWGDCDVLVTSGVGFYGPPVRVGTVSEIAVLDLK